MELWIDSTVHTNLMRARRQEGTGLLAHVTNIVRKIFNFFSCRKLQVMASSNIFFRKDAQFGSAYNQIV